MSKESFFIILLLFLLIALCDITLHHVNYSKTQRSEGKTVIQSP